MITRKQILKRANQLCDMLLLLQGKFKNLALRIEHEYEDLQNDESIQNLQEVLFDLYNFDMQDPIINAMGE